MCDILRSGQLISFKVRQMTKIKTIATLGVLATLFISGCTSENSQTEFDHYNWSSSDSGLRFMTSETAPETPKLPGLTENSGLSDYLAYAALNNPGLEATFNRWKAALDRVPQVKSLPDPRFNYK